MKNQNEFKVGAIINRPQKSNNGITLIALILTIIILLILAGVSINLVAGSNGILNRVKVAVNATNLANIKEELELKIAELQLDYYSDSSLRNSYATVNVYVKAKFKEGIEISNGADITCDDDGNLSYDEQRFGTLNPNGTITIDAEFDGGQMVSKYRVTYDANGGTGNVPATAKYESGETVTVDFSTTPTREKYTFLGWSTSSSATTPEYTTSGSFAITKNTTLYAVWSGISGQGTSIMQGAWYGDKVNYSANGVEDWQVFLNDGSNIYIISKDIVEGSTLNIVESGVNVNANHHVYVTDNNQITLINWMSNTHYWTEFMNSRYANQGVGGPTLEQLAISANGKLKTNYTGDTIKNQILNDKLYKASYYWYVASIATEGNQGAWTVSPDGKIVYMPEVRGNYPADIRPLIRLKPDVKMSWNGEVWDLSI